MRKTKAPGYRILVRLKPIVKSKEVMSSGGIVMEIRNDRDVELEEQGMTEGHVIDVGEVAFKNLGEPWCKKGDCVLIYKHSGTLLSNMGDEYTYRMVQDLDIQAVFPDEGIEL